MAVEEDRDEDMIGLLAKGMPKHVAEDFVNVYELFLINGASPSDARAKVCELFSPPRVTAEAQRLPILEIIPGSTFDLRADRHGRTWNFLLESDRKRAKKQIMKEKPFLVVGSPPCTYFSRLMELNRHRMDPAAFQRALGEARVLLDFAAEIYETQLRGGRHFLHEHPESASSWCEPRVWGLLSHPKVSSVVAHLCQYGMVTVGKDGERVPARKATRFMSSSKAVLEKLSRKCDRSHTHQHLVSGRAKAAAIYPPALCRAILRGIAEQKRLEGEAVPDHILEATDKGCAIYHLRGKEEEG